MAMRNKEGLRIIAVDDEPLALSDLVQELGRMVPTEQIQAFGLPGEALAYVAEHPADVVFCDIEMPGMNGIAFAKRLKETCPQAHVVFVTSYDHYAVEAFSVCASGYLLKPVDAAELARELEFICGEAVAVAPAAPPARIEVVTFGRFEVRVDGVPLNLRRSKSRELFALLVDLQGAKITSRDACEVLWEGRPYNNTLRSYYHTALSELRSALNAAGVGDVLAKDWNSVGVRPEAISCDLYRFLAGDADAINAYHGKYLPEYSWAEFSNARLESKRRS